MLPDSMFTLLSNIPDLFPLSMHNSPHSFEGRRDQLKISPAFFCLERTLAFRSTLGERNSQNPILFHAQHRKGLNYNRTHEAGTFISAIAQGYFFFL